MIWLVLPKHIPIPASEKETSDVSKALLPLNPFVHVACIALPTAYTGKEKKTKKKKGRKENTRGPST